MKRITALFACLMLLMTTCAYAGPVDRISSRLRDAVENTPPENIFQIKGSAKQYILLDSTEDEKSKYFVMSKQFFEPVEFDMANTQRFEPEKKGNVGYYLNTTLLNTGDDYGEKLDDEIVKHIDFQHEWLTEAGTPSGACPEDYTFTAGLSLLSQTEWMQYAGKFGAKDDGEAWWLRTGRGISGANSAVLIVMSGDNLGTTSAWNANSARWVRPVFYLDDQFFRQVRLEVENLGQNVKRQMRADMTWEELAAVGYTQEEIDAIFTDSQPLLESVSVKLKEMAGNIFDKGNFYFDTEISTNQAGKQTYSVSYRYGDGPGDKDVYAGSIDVMEGRTAAIRFDVQTPEYGAFRFVVTVRKGDRIVRQEKFNIGIIQPYTPQFMELYSGKGYNTKGDDTDVALFERFGINTYRSGREWRWVETQKGVFDKSKDNKNLDRMLDGGRIIYLLGYNNVLYNGRPSSTANADKYGVFTKENADAFARYAVTMAQWHPNLTDFSLWNEPNGPGFWFPDCSNEIDYTYLMQVVYEELRRQDPTLNLYCGDFQPGGDYFARMMENGNAYAYFDGVSDHPYATLLDVVFPVNYSTLETITDHTPWKMYASTEFGSSTYQNGEINFYDYDTGLNLVKHCVIGDMLGLSINTLYCFRDPGTDKINRESSYGIIRRNLEPKESFNMIKTYLNATAGAVYMGNIDMGENCEFHLYRKDGKLFAVAWSKIVTREPGDKTALNGTEHTQKGALDKTLLKETDIALDIPHQSLIVKDIDGNIRPKTDKLIVGNEPVYLYGLDDGFYNRALSEAVESDIERMTARSDNQTVNAKLQEAKDKALSMLQGNVLASRAQLEDYLDAYFSIADLIVAQQKDGALQLTDEQIALLLFDLHKLGQKFCNYYAATIPGDAPFAIDDSNYQRVLAETQAMANTHIGGGFVYTDSIIKYASQYLKMARYIGGIPESNPMKAGMVISQMRLLNGDMQIAEAMRSVEQPQTVHFLVQMRRDQRSFYNYSKNKVNIDLYNYGKKEAGGTVGLYDKDGKQVFLSDHFLLKEGESASLPVEFILREQNAADTAEYTLKYHSDTDGVLWEQTITASILQKYSVELQPSKVTTDNISEIKVNLTNEGLDTEKGTVKVTPPAGWSISEDEKRINIKPGATKELTFHVDTVSQAAFHQYSFRFDVTNDAGELVTSETLPLNFILIAKAKQEHNLDTFDGSMDAWTDSYPVYLHPPENLYDTKEWQKQNLAARIFTEWDENYLYVMLNVFKDRHINVQDDSRAWDGDSVQVSIDTGNTKTNAYSAGDYEFTFAKLSEGDVTVMHYPGSGVVDLMGKIVRVEKDKTTNYLIKIPKTEIPPMTLEAGKTIGFNIALNGATEAKRNLIYEITEGSTNVKNPSKYHSWTLVGR